ncbi:MAG: glycosyltransferase family 2 protein [Planctomycetota bacterium]
MPELEKNKATICIANYKTLSLIKLCLRSIRKFTSYPYEVIVVDNNSQDDSLEYLKSLSWIRLIEHRPSPEEPGGGYAHGAALDSGLADCNTEFFVSMHSDTFVQQTNWLSHLVSYFSKDKTIACVGSGKIELSPKWQVLIKKMTDYKIFWRKLLRTPDPMDKFRYYNRTICGLYRTDVLRRENLTFLMDRNNGFTAGKKLYFELVDRRYKTVELPSSIMAQYVIHLAHATQVINLEEFSLRNKTVRKCNRLADKIMSSSTVKDILADDSLDR